MVVEVYVKVVVEVVVLHYSYYYHSILVRLLHVEEKGWGHCFPKIADCCYVFAHPQVECAAVGGGGDYETLAGRYRSA